MTNAVQQQPRVGNTSMIEQFQSLHLLSFEGSTNHKAPKFERGLRDGLRRPISMLRLQTYGEVLHIAQILDNDDEMSVKAESK
ncbi:hypothetical protein FEM48_Zijuj04G0106900 [Ziziphus jujuba var. spinosa]|uniref:Uncharacterized protein n=1 Tax=Ziziphus jujuba var. spinosa TaxID=714518 RepID=A0A978VJF1_ZIZJJ|nr:hypothetical protein FEM48_Zijuj04G0106900 [Ziziphus jujuba var. spinosa]